jgi:branched-chain amino acid transport system permease protein
MTLLGGLGTILGPVVGAFLLVTMETYLSQTGSWVTIIEGLIFVFCVLAFRRGIVGVVAPYVTGRRPASTRLPEPPPAPAQSPLDKVPEVAAGSR